MTITAYRPVHRHHLGDDVWDRVTYTIGQSPVVQDLQFEHATDRILDQTIPYLLCCGWKDPAEPFYAASEWIDEGWHGFVLNLGPYLEFCQANFGWTLIHAPRHPVLDAGGSLRDGTIRAKAAMLRNGFVVDEIVWGGSWADCGACPI